MSYAQKGQYGSAIAQLKLAAELEPNDAEIHAKLLECLDKQGNQEDAVKQAIQSLQLSRRDINGYRNLGERYRQLGRFDEMERAQTSIVEMLPNESESHAMLAEIRQTQDRWQEAVEHWKRVDEIRSLEPTGLLRLAEAQIHLQQWGAASETVQQLKTRSWPSRFGNVTSEIRSLDQQIQRGRSRIQPASGDSR